MGFEMPEKSREFDDLLLALRQSMSQVFKFGGASIETPERARNVAKLSNHICMNHWWWLFLQKEKQPMRWS